MQTRTPSFRSVSFIAKRVCALLCTAILMPALTACSMPGSQAGLKPNNGKARARRPISMPPPITKIAHDQHQHIIRRYFSAQQAVSAWTNTAAQCPARFAEGTLRSAQARHMARALGDQLSVAVAPITLSRFDDVESLDVDSKSLATAAQDEDRAGFAMEVLAARNSGHATLDISDRHKTTSQRFASFSGAIDDRRKTYEATALLAHPDTMLDSATGLTAPTDATIEMNCARSEITAIAGSSNAANDHSQSRVTNAKQSTDSRAQSPGVLAGLIADRVELALDWGYPSFDEALFA